MARIRSIKPEFWCSEQIVELSPIARLLFIGLWNFCDDGGAHPASAKTLKMEVFPGDDFTGAQVDGWMTEIIKQGLVLEYQADGKPYWLVTGWAHQKIDRPNCKYPKPNSTSIRRAFDDRSPKDVEGKGRDIEGKGKKENTQRADFPENEGQEPAAETSEVQNEKAAPTQCLPVATTPPTPAEVVHAWCKDNLETLRAWCSEVGFTAGHGLVKDQISDFCVWYGTKAFEHLQARFQADPEGFFRESFRGWLRRSVEQRKKPARKKAAPDDAGAYTPEGLTETFRSKYGQGFAERLTSQNLQRFMEAKSDAQVSFWMEGVYDKMKSGGQVGARRGETTLTNLMQTTH